MTEVREHFASRLGTILTMVGVAVGLGNIWRFPYLVGRYGGAAFVAFYVLVALVIGVPALLAEWTLGRHTGRGTLGAFQRGRLPGGRFVGGALFCVVVAATAYYTNVVGWVLYFALSELLSSIGIALDASAILPPETGVSGRSILLQVACTGVVIASCAFVIDRGLRAGIERASTVIMPTLFVILVVLIVRSLTLPGADEGVRWFIGRFAWRDLTPTVMVAAMGQAIFSLSLGGTFMVTYGSYLPAGTPLRTSAAWTALGDTTAGLMAGLVIFPAVFAFGLSPSSGPGLLFDTLPRVFGQMPGGGLFGALFFVGLFGAAFLSDVAALEVLIAGVVDNTALTRRKAISLMAAIVGLVALVPMINLKIFVAWDLTFGSGMQALGALLSVLTMGWFVQRATLLEQLGDPGPARRILVTCIRYVIPAAMLTVGLWWLLTDLLHLLPTV
ncbi:MAG: sodium-dependent transporter [Gemmatimonadetes bacterium]|nr:sodium-dependent transporter [Gemmatimonadota bacterium]